MKILSKYFILVGLLVSILSCSKKGNVAPVPDTTNPTITITQPTAGQVFAVGNTITFQASFADNDKLGSYSITITKVISSGMVLKNVLTPVAWSYSKSATSFTTGVKQQNITLNDITIPLLIGTSPVLTGKYDFNVSCVDGSNNSASTTIEININ
jgi:hypothetical protein